MEFAPPRRDRRLGYDMASRRTSMTYPERCRDQLRLRRRASSDVGGCKSERYALERKRDRLAEAYADRQEMPAEVCRRQMAKLDGERAMLALQRQDADEGEQ